MSDEHVFAELNRLRAVWDFAAEWQITAAGFWMNLQFFLGTAAAALAAVSSGTAFSKQSVLAGSLAAAAAIAAAVLASLRPAERAERHQRSAAEYHGLAIDVHLLLDLGVRDEESNPADALQALELRGKDLDAKSPWAPRRLVRKTQSYMASGRRYFDNTGEVPARSETSGP